MRDCMDRRVTPPKRGTSPNGVPLLHVNRPLRIQLNLPEATAQNAKYTLVTYRRWSLTRIEPTGLVSEKRSQHIHLSAYNLVHALSM